ncbi:MAG: hypothetical protein V1776_02180 [Candidatus Diapherotrites archaeon]
MNLEKWMINRKEVLLHEKKDKLFDLLPHAPDYHTMRAELHYILSQIENVRRENEPIIAMNILPVPMIA